MSKPGRNPYLDDDDEVDDFTFLSHNATAKGSSVFSGSSTANAANDQYMQRKQQLLEQRRKIEERTLQSSKVSLGLVYESEKVGIATAEELMRQREKLENVDEHLDGINATMRTTQKHLTTMKSWLGGMFSKNATPAAGSGGTATIPGSKSTPGLNGRNGSSKLGDTVEKISSESSRRSSANHPALVNRGIDTSGFRFDDEEPAAAKGQPPTSGAAHRSCDIDRQLDENLGELGLGLSRLKGLALGLGEEIEQQNEIIEKITTKAERSEDTIQYQNRQMRNLLKK